MELKTLNDMKRDLRYSTVEDGTGLFSDSVFIDSFKLKQEAIMWIKLGRVNPERAMAELYELENPIINVSSIQELSTVEGVKIPQAFSFISKWIKHFFNITEDDL